MENSKEIFGLALGLVSPWFVTSVRFETENNSKELHIDISFLPGSKFMGEDNKEYTAHDTVQRRWQHLNFFQHKCYLNAKVPRIKQLDGHVKTIQVPWARKNSGFTLLFEAFSMLLIENEMPVKNVSEIMNVYPQRIWNIFGYWISKAHNEDEITDLTKLGFDETSTAKGHNYVTTAVDLEQKRVLFATVGKNSECIEKTVDYLGNKNVNTENINQVCIDMSPAFIAGCTEFLPKAAITFDKFHVIKEVNKAMDELRKLERQGNDMLKGHKYTFLKNKLSPKIEQERELLLEMYPKLGEGFRLVQLFKDFWEKTDVNEARGYLAFWCDLAVESGIFPFIKAVNTIKAHWTGIINYLDSRINNGLLEGINSKIQLMKKRARGYRNIQNFINMIYFTCGKLKFSYPLFSI
jgi:transposase